jgi:hypothetical protein
MKTLPQRLGLLCLLLAAAAAALSGCVEMMSSDASNFGRKSAQARQAALVGNRLASQQAARARGLAGEELSRFLAGKTHVSEYRKATSDAQPYYAEYVYFSPDGRFLWLNTYEQNNPATTAWGTWQVKGDVLCVTQQRGDAEPRCHTVRLQADGTVQYWTHQPGDAFHGLLSARVSIIREGPQTPAFVTPWAQMR